MSEQRVAQARFTALYGALPNTGALVLLSTVIDQRSAFNSAGVRVKRPLPRNWRSRV
jgi:hypothetical protein